MKTQKEKFKGTTKGKPSPKSLGIDKKKTTPKKVKGCGCKK